jgi:hypothetical protein
LVIISFGEHNRSPLAETNGHFFKNKGIRQMPIFLANWILWILFELTQWQESNENRVKTKTKHHNL